MNWNDCTIKILGKGSKERLIFFGIDKLTNLFNELFKIRDELGIESPYLFVSYQHRKVLYSLPPAHPETAHLQRKA